MQASGRPSDTCSISLGQRRGISDLARIALDLTWAGAESVSSARTGGYPSPPMSGSPPLPPTTSQEATERIQGAYQTIPTTAPTTVPTAAQDAYRGIPPTQGEIRPHVGTTTPLLARPGSYAAPEAHDRMPFPFPRAESSFPRPLSYPTQHGQQMPQHYLPPITGTAMGSVSGSGSGPGQATLPGPQPTSYPLNAPQTTQEGLLETSPKIQRKTKGHVISACVPCKKAHLRCDTQRPCSRCLSNGKEDSCIDVQHKKRGRPRLRDDRETRFEASRFGVPADPIMSRPVSLYGTPTSMGMAYDENLRRTQSYRVLKSQPAESITPRFPERGAISDANIFPAPLSISTRPPEPAAILTMEFEIAKASTTFLDAIGRSLVQGHRLVDLVVAGDRDKAGGCQRQMHEEQKKSQHSYLPRIVGKEDEARVMQSLGFSADELARYSLDRQEYLTFMAQDGQSRPFGVRMGLAKQDSVSFVVIVLASPTRFFQHPTPSPNPRDIKYPYQPPQPPHPSYSQPTPTSATFDPRQGRPGEMGYGPRPALSTGAPPQLATGVNPGMPASYAAPPSRAEYSGGQHSYQIPRSELHHNIPSRGPQASTAGYQLPPIRSDMSSQPQQNSPSFSTRDERSRVDIGGLIDRPDPRPPQ